MIASISIEKLFSLAASIPVLDVRSPGEYAHAHIPGAINLPLFSDEERKIIGTAYKKESRETAIKLGLDFFGVKMKAMVERTEKIVADHLPTGQTYNPQPATRKSVIVHCWRGGMRSSAVAWLLNLYGFEVYLLEDGYKTYRNHVLQQFEKEYNLNIIGGYTGSGKTQLLKSLKEAGHTIIDLEKLANHKGSAFGTLKDPQPQQEMFENILAAALDTCDNNACWIEDESQRIGSLNIPNNFWKTMRACPVYFLEIPFEERLENIVSEYGSTNKEILSESIERIKKRLGPLETKAAIQLLQENNIAECFRILLTYYDKHYLKSLHKRENLAELLNKIDCVSVDTMSNFEKLISCAQVNI